MIRALLIALFAFVFQSCSVPSNPSAKTRDDDIFVNLTKMRGNLCDDTGRFLSHIKDEIRKMTADLDPDGKVRAIAALIDIRDGLHPRNDRFIARLVMDAIPQEQIRNLLNKKRKSAEEWRVLLATYDPLQAAATNMITPEYAKMLSATLAEYLAECDPRLLTDDDRMYTIELCLYCLGSAQIPRQENLWRALEGYRRRANPDDSLAVSARDWIRIRDNDLPAIGWQQDLLSLAYWKNIQWSAANRLGNAAESNREVRLSLIACLDDSRHMVRAYAALAIRCAETPLEARVRMRLRDVFEHDPYEFTRRRAAETLLWHIEDPGGTESIPLFDRLANDRNQTTTVRIWAKGFAERCRERLSADNNKRAE